METLLRKLKRLLNRQKKILLGIQAKYILLGYLHHSLFLRYFTILQVVEIYSNSYNSLVLRTESRFCLSETFSVL